MPANGWNWAKASLKALGVLFEIFIDGVNGRMAKPGTLKLEVQRVGDWPEAPGQQGPGGGSGRP